MAEPFFRNQRILVTGASSGIGAALSRQFAAGGGHVAMVARRGDRLESMVREFAEGPGKGVAVVADLVESGTAVRVVEEATAKLGGPIDVLVNNAGIGEYGRFVDNPVDDLDRMMTLNVHAVVQLTRVVLPGMVERKQGRVLSIASSAAFQPTPYMAVYGATKAFVLHFSMAIWQEVRKQGVGVTCVCPGPVDTEFFDRGGYETRKGDFAKIAMQPERVAAEAIRALAARRSAYVPGWGNKFGAIAHRFAPLRTVTRITGKVLRPG